MQFERSRVIQSAQRDRGLESGVRLAAGQCCRLTHSHEEGGGECSHLLRGSEFLVTRSYLSTLFGANCEEEESYIPYIGSFPETSEAIFPLCTLKTVEITEKILWRKIPPRVNAFSIGRNLKTSIQDSVLKAALDH